MTIKQEVLKIIKARPSERWSLDDLSTALGFEKEAIRRSCKSLVTDGELLGCKVMVYGVNKPRHMVR